MGRTLLTGKTTSATQLDAVPRQREGAGAGATSEQLRRMRSRPYLDAIGTLDSGGTILDAAAIMEIRNAVAAEFPNGPASWPLGWVAKCYLGTPYEVHMLDLSGQIVRHFSRGEAMPGGLDRARALAASGQYTVIEVFSDQVVAIALDGSTSVLKF